MVNKHSFLVAFFAIWMISVGMMFYGINNSEFIKLGIFVNAPALVMLLMDFYEIKYNELTLGDLVGDEE